MNKFDLLGMSLKSLWRRKTRTLLTVLGVVIGTTSIIIMLSLGIAMDQGFKEQLKQMGSLNIIEVQGNYEGSIPTGESRQAALLDAAAVNRFSKLNEVEAVMPRKSAFMRVVSGKMVGDISIIGVIPQHLVAFDFNVQEGRLLLASDKEAILFGNQVMSQFYDSRLRNPMANGSSNPPQVDLVTDRLILTADMEYGQRRRSNTDADYKPPEPHAAKGIGILTMSNDEKDYSAYMNITTLEKIIAEDQKGNRELRTQSGTTQYDTIKVKVREIDQVVAVQDKIKAMGYQVYSLTDMLNEMKKTSRTLQAILGGIGAISLLVAAIGITNTMIMSIYERTREIGVIKVLGANVADIKRLFLIEAALIGFGGGVIGALFSYLTSWVLNKVGAGFMANMGGTSSISVIPFWLTLSAVVFATLVGIVSGYSPARRAMNLSALDAIRAD